MKYFSLIVPLMLGAPAFGNVNLEWRKPIQSVCVGDTVRLGLYAVSTGPTETLSAVDLVFAWDSTYLTLVGTDQTGAAPVQSASFVPNDIFGLNEVVPPQDGNGLLVIFAQFGSPIPATPAGTLLTTFVFQAAAASPGAITVDIPPAGGSPQINTTVWSGTQANTPVTGSLGSAAVGVVFQICPADINDDQIVDLLDLTLLLASFGINNGGDQDCDGDTDLSDLTMLLSQFGSTCN